MNKFNVGDRFRVYAISDNGEPFAIDDVVAYADTVMIRSSVGRIYHYKQCRKLVKKPRREFWIIACSKLSHQVYCTYTPKLSEPCCKIIKVREVKEK